MAKKRATLTDLLNDLTFRNLFNKYKMLAMSQFEWVGLPEGLESKHIERALFNFGKAIFFKDPNASYMCLEAQTSGKQNVYGEPLGWIATGVGYHKHVKDEDCVIISNNILRVSTYDIVMHYVNKMTECERTMDVNVKAVKTPYIFACDDKDVMTFKRMFQQIDGNVPALYMDRGINLDSISVMQTGVKFLCNDIMDYKKSVENELFTFLGFNNSPIDKKERVNVHEVESNNQLIESFGDLGFRSRQMARDEIREMFGLADLDVIRKEVNVNALGNELRDHGSDAGTE